VSFPEFIEVVDSHTEGEPTRVVISGWPAMPGGTMVDRRASIAAEHDLLRRAVVCEPRGHEAMVGALLTAPVEPDSIAGVVFFNNAGPLWMCGHGLIGVVRTLEHLGRVEAVAGRSIRIDTPAGTVSAELEAGGAVTIENVPAYCHRRDVEIDVPGIGRVRGDVAWGGNWFFLTELPGVSLALDNATELTALTARILAALGPAGVTGRDGAEIDHVEMFGPAKRPDADSRNFVLCPGLAYDRSPCGTGTSAKLAVLAARGKLEPGAIWRQESITGSLFTAWYSENPGTAQGEATILPKVRGCAFVTGRARLLFDPADPFRTGFTAAGPSPVTS
jgi:4-hydroxyproline epimerase